MEIVAIENERSSRRQEEEAEIRSDTINKLYNNIKVTFLKKYSTLIYQEYCNNNYASIYSNIDISKTFYMLLC